MEIVKRIGLRWKREGRLRLWLFYALLACLLFSCVAASLFSVLDYQIYGTQVLRTVAEEHEGIAHIKKAQMLLSQFSQHAADLALIDQAEQEFSLAQDAFIRLNGDLDNFPAASRHVPFLNMRLSAGRHLVPLSIWMARAGIESCSGLKNLLQRFHDPLKAQGAAVTQDDLDFMQTEIHKVRQYVEAALSEGRQLRPSDVSYDARTAAMFDSFQKTVPMLYSWLTDIEQVLPVLPELLGLKAPANYLLELLDSAELRPGGGVISAYGFATFYGARMTAMHIIDVNLLDKPFASSGHHIPYPSEYQWFSQAQQGWNLRNVNLDVDFPTSARYAELNYAREGGNMPVQGVIAITPALIQRLLSLSGADQLSTSTHSAAYQPLVARLPASIDTSQNEHLLQGALERLSSVSLGQLLQVLVESIRSKDLQIYFNSSIAENILLHHQLASALVPHAGDGLLVVDTNVGGNRANSALLNWMRDQVKLGEDRSALHTTTLNYAWSPASNILGSVPYHGYVRLYLPINSTIQAQKGWDERGTSIAGGYRLLQGEFLLGSEQAHAITVQWTEPDAVKRDSSGLHYRFLLQRQAGTQWQVDMQMKLPACAYSVRVGGGLQYEPAHGAALSQSLDQDLAPSVDYIC